MKKFFLFKRNDISLSSTSVSDTGEGLDVLAVPADSLAFMTAESGSVSIVFNEASIYEANNLLDGESFKKTSVSVSCEEGTESDLIESILKFISSESTTTNIMRFDAVLGKSTFGGAKVSATTDLVSRVNKFPVNRSSQETSTKTFIGGTSGTAFGTGNEISGIDFGDGNKPFIDYNEDGLGESGGNVNAWTNAGTGGATYNASGIVGAIPLDTSTGRANNGLATSAADISSATSVTIPAAQFKKDFTFYCVIGRSESDIRNSVNIGPVAQGVNTLFPLEVFNNNTFFVKIRDGKGPGGKPPALSPIVTVDQTAYIFIVRRDSRSNIFFHDATGAVVGVVDSVTSGSFGRTDELLSLTSIGNGQSVKFQGNVARFGVIGKDIGTAAASRLALDLVKKYTPTT